MSLKEEIIERRKEISVDAYPMSIGELMNLYKDGEIDVHPEFQRFFRWDEEQKTKLIESILLGIPIPPIFVSQKVNGTWDLIDGQQRISTILQFLQVLKKNDGTLYKPLILRPTRFLPSLAGVRWDDETLFSIEQKIAFKREKLNFTIIKETAENDIAKYELFQRLNTGGTHLSAQEIRNCLMIMRNRDLFNLINELGEDRDFNKCLPLTDAQIEERYDLEIIVRYILYVNFSDEFIRQIDKTRNMDTFLTEELDRYAQNIDSCQLQASKEKFFRIFSLLNDILGEDTFKKYQDDKFKGPFMIAAFESIIPGLFINLCYFESHREHLLERIKKIYTQEEFINAVRRGTRALDRMAQLIQFSRHWFSHEN